jgi:hypothetical protein
MGEQPAFGNRLDTATNAFDRHGTELWQTTQFLVQ